MGMPLNWSTWCPLICVYGMYGGISTVPAALYGDCEATMRRLQATAARACWLEVHAQRSGGERRHVWGGHTQAG